jgi:hypothetical protein
MMACSRWNVGLATFVGAPSRRRAAPIVSAGRPRLGTVAFFLFSSKGGGVCSLWNALPIAERLGALDGPRLFPVAVAPEGAACTDAAARCHAA